MDLLEHLTDDEVQRLWHTGQAWHIFRGPAAERDGFEGVAVDELFDDARWDDGYAHWFETTSDALLYLAFVRSKGAEGALLWDMNAGQAIVGGPMDGEPTGEYCVVTLGYQPDVESVVSSKEWTARKRAADAAGIDWHTLPR